MDSKLEKIREVQKEAWNKSSAGWKKWDDINMRFLKPMSDEMIRMLSLKDDDIVLDVATGTGEPGLTIASTLKMGKLQALTFQKKWLQLLKKMLRNGALKILKQFVAMSQHFLF